MKFDKLFERAEILGCKYVVTGHYARIGYENRRFVLKKALDEAKDQSYVLYSMTQAQLAHTLFPLGNLEKAETRRIAEESGFDNAKKPDSQDICFVPDGDYAKIIEQYTGHKAETGHFVDSNGNILGKHRGIIHYTVGQHRGLGLSLPERRYVCGICSQTQSIVLGSEAELYRKDVYAEDFNWISGQIPRGTFRCKAKVRYRQREQWAAVMPDGESAVRVVFDEPQRAVTPGQALVLYDGDTVLGGGTICKDER